MKHIFLLGTIVSSFIGIMICMETQLPLMVQNNNTEIRILRTFAMGCEINKKNKSDPFGFAFHYFFNDDQPIQSMMLSSDSKFLFLIRAQYMEVIHLSTKTYQEIVAKKEKKESIDVAWGIVKKCSRHQLSSAIKSIIQESTESVTIYEENGTRSDFNFSEIVKN